MELRIIPSKLPTPPTFSNFEEIKAAAQNTADLYTRTVYDASQMSEAKAHRATMNKLKKALNDERIKQERTYMMPFASFKAQIGEIIGIIDTAVDAIDVQIKAHEEKRRSEKKAQIEGYWNSLALPRPVQLEQVMDEKWLNASVSMEAVKKAIAAKLEALNAAEVTPEQPEQTRYWLAFRAKLTVEDAEALGDFFTRRGIEFEQID